MQARQVGKEAGMWVTMLWAANYQRQVRCCCCCPDYAPTTTTTQTMKNGPLRSKEMREMKRERENRGGETRECQDIEDRQRMRESVEEKRGFTMGRFCTGQLQSGILRGQVWSKHCASRWQQRLTDMTNIYIIPQKTAEMIAFHLRSLKGAEIEESV